MTTTRRNFSRHAAGFARGTPRRARRASRRALLASRRARHAATGLVYMKNRWYSPTLGRFLTSDPLQEGPDANRQRYVGNDPINHFDPLGLEDQSTWYSVAWKVISYDLTHPMSFYGRQSSGMLALASGDIDGAKTILNAAAHDALHNTSYTGGDNEYSLAYNAIKQGEANALNGLQDAIVGIANLPILFYNMSQWAQGNYTRAEYFQSWNWSKGLFMQECGTHGASKFIGGQALMTLLTLGLGSWASSASVAPRVMGVLASSNGTLSAIAGGSTVAAIAVPAVRILGAAQVLAALNQIQVMMSTNGGGGGAGSGGTNNNTQLDQLTSQWDKGSFDSAEDNILWHYNSRHGHNFSSLQDYLEAAERFFSRNDLELYDVANDILKFRRGNEFGFISKTTGKFITYGIN